MTQDTRLQQLVINKLTTAQYNAAVQAGTINENQLYMTTDSSIVKDVTVNGTSINDNGVANIVLGTMATENKNNYPLDSNVVHRSGNETIGGDKTFSNHITMNNKSIYIKNSEDKNAIINPSSIEFMPISTQSHGGFLDFHYKGDTSDNTSRIIESSSGTININGVELIKNGYSTLPRHPNEAVSSSMQIDTVGARVTACNTKVDKVTSAYKLYGTDSSGNQTTYSTTDFDKVGDVKIDGVSIVSNKIANLGSMANEDVSNYSTKAVADTLYAEKALETTVSTKVDKVSTANKVYGTDSNGLQTTYSVNSFGNVDNVTVNGTSVVTNKVAAITLGTMANESSSNYYNKTEIDGLLTGAMHFKGVVATLADLYNIQNPSTGDMYNVQETSSNYAWDGTQWVELSESIDLSHLAEDADVVHLTGNETISGIKNFNDNIGVKGYLYVKDNTIDETTPVSGTGKSIQFDDKNNTRLGYIRSYVSNNGENGLDISATRTVNGSTVFAGIQMDIDSSGNKNITVSQPTENTTSSSQIDTVGARVTALQTKANISLDNLDSVGNQIIDTEDGKISNCIVNIPQNIKLELVGNVLTLKAGSVITYLNGTQSSYTTTIDGIKNLSTDTISENRDYYIFVSGNSSNPSLAIDVRVDLTTSGNTADIPTSGLIAETGYYDVEAKILYYRNSNNTEWSTKTKNPVGIIRRYTDGTYKLLQVFNGALYLGHHIIVFPNIDMYYANGIDANGNMKNVLVTTNSFKTIEALSGYGSDSLKRWISIQPNKVPSNWTAYQEVETESDADFSKTNVRYYIKDINLIKLYHNNSISVAEGIPFIEYYGDGTNITYFKIRQPVRLVTTDMIGNMEAEIASNTSAIALKADDSGVVHTTGNETINGTKTFKSAIMQQRNSTGITANRFQNTVITKGTLPTNNSYVFYDFNDSTTTGSTTGSVGSMRLGIDTSGTTSAELVVFKSELNSSSNSHLGIYYPTSGNPYTKAPTPTDTTSTSGTQIATTGWVNTRLTTKQDNLTAGANIDITNNVISANFDNFSKRVVESFTATANQTDFTVSNYIPGKDYLSVNVSNVELTSGAYGVINNGYTVRLTEGVPAGSKVDIKYLTDVALTDSGATFTPSVSKSGYTTTLSWSNDRGLNNPSTTQIYDGVTFTPSQTKSGNAATISWTNNQGKTNPSTVTLYDGATFTPSETISQDGSQVTISWSNDRGLQNPADVTLHIGQDNTTQRFIETFIATANQTQFVAVRDIQGVNVLSVNINNTELTSAAYSLGVDKRTVTLVEPVAAGAIVELKYFHNLVLAETDITIDSELSNVSTNPVQNRVINNALGVINTNLNGKQPTLVSGTNIKTINNTSLLGNGNITITDTTYSDMVGADGTNAGSSGLVPAPAANANGKYLRGDGTWQTPTNTKNTAGSTDTSSQIYLVGTTSQTSNAQTYSHDTVYVDTNGQLVSATPSISTNSTVVATTGWVNTKFQVVSELPANPDPDTFYFILE